MKTRRARTVAKSVTENTIVLRSRISLPISFAVFVEMQAIWPEIALIDKRAPAGVMMVHVLLLVVLAEVMVLTVNTR